MQKNAAMADIKNQIGSLSVENSENYSKTKLDNADAHNALVEKKSLINLT